MKKKSLPAPVISLYISLNPDKKASLRSALRSFPLHLETKPLTEKNVSRDTEILCVFVDSPVNESILKKMPKLKLIIAMSTGYDHIDLDSAKKRKVTVCNIPWYGENTVAEHTLALMLSLSRRLFESVKLVKEGIYDYHGLRGFDIKGKTIGIIGTGRIGLHLIALLQGFEANVIAYDAFLKKEMAEKFHFSYVPLKKLFGQSDIISLHAPLLAETHHLINKKTLKSLKKGVYIINTARGALIDTAALLLGLENEIIAGAALDVLEGEEYLQHPEHMVRATCSSEDTKLCLMNNLLIDHPHTIVTPHNAFNSMEAVQRIFDDTVITIKKYVQGEKLENTLEK